MPTTSFSDMPILAPPNATHTPSPPLHRRRKSWARRIERCCCQTFAYFPLVFVYGLTSWAVYVEVDTSFMGLGNGLAYFRAGLGVVLYTLANVSYTIAVFTNPGSPLDPRKDYGEAAVEGRRKRGGYEGLPSYEEERDSNGDAVPREWMTTVTAKSTGKPRFCKKCQCVKPDRAHHCSTCGKCVLKMDHHCPWLATCVGLRNYKAFILFLVYTSLFCWVCFLVSAWWVWAEIMDSNAQFEEGFRVVNTILLAVLSGIIGLVLTGFTGWHIYLVVTGQTTIESLEKTRYLSPVKKSMERQFQAGRNYLGEEDGGFSEDQPLGDRLKEIHANALPGVLRPEEGEDSRTPSRGNTPVPPAPAASNSSPAQESLQRSYASMEAQRERERYNMYLDEQDSEKLPNAFDLGRKRNLLHVLGNNPLLWFLPVLNTTGDGWMWEVSPDWTEARDRMSGEREHRARAEAAWDQSGPAPNRTAQSFEPPRGRDWKWTPGSGFVNQQKNLQPPPRNSSLMNGHGNEMQPLDRRKTDEGDGYDGDDDTSGRHARANPANGANWNDVPEDFLAPSGHRVNRSRSHGRKKGD